MHSTIRLLALMLAASCAIAAASQPADSTRARAQTAIHDIRGPLPLPSVPPFVLSGGVLLLAAGLLLVSRRRAAREPTAAAPATVTGRDADELLASIAADYRQGLCSGEQLLFRLDSLLCATLAASNGIPAPCLTSPELTALAQAVLNSGELALLVGFLALGDRVKFAGHRPGPDEIEAVLNSVGTLLAGSAIR